MFDIGVIDCEMWNVCCGDWCVLLCVFVLLGVMLLLEGLFVDVIVDVVDNFV